MTLLETRPFSASSSWNTAVKSDAAFTKLNWPSSTGYNYSVAWDSYSPAVYVASNSDPLVQVTYPPGWGYPGGTVSVHMPTAANGAAGTDGELIVIDGDVAYNFWQFNRTGTNSGSAASFGAENIVTGDGWGSKSPFLSAGITAVGASELGGLVVKDETNDGSIDHALQLVVDAKLVQSGMVGQAISSDGSSASGIVKEGQLLAIPPGTPMPAGLSALGQQVFTALQKYGAYVVDVAGGTTNIRAQSNAFDDATMTSLWHDMGNITPLLQGVSGGTTSGETGGGATQPPVTTPPVVTTPPPVTSPPVTAPPVTSPPVTTPPVTSPATDTAKPTLQWIAANGPGLVNGGGTVRTGDTVRLTLKLSEAVTVTGTPTLGLNDRGVARYVSGTGTDTLQFDYKVAAGQNTADLAISSFALSGVKDLAGNVVNLAGAPRQPAGTLVVDTKAAPVNPTAPATPLDTTAPKVQCVAASGAGISDGHGKVGAGDTVRLSVNFNEAVTVTGTPTLSLNSAGTAKYVGGAGTNTLQFDYAVKSGETAADLEIAGYNLNGVKDRAGNAVDLRGSPHQPGGVLAVGTAQASDPTAPQVRWISTSGSSIRNGHGVVSAGDTVWVSVNFDEVMTVSGKPNLSLNSNGTAQYVSGSGTNTLQFKYVVGAGQTAPDLEVSGYHLDGVTDRSGKSVNLDGAPQQPGGVLRVDGGGSLAKTSSLLAEPSASTEGLAATSASKSWTAGSSSVAAMTDPAFASNRTLGYSSGNDNAVAAAAPGLETAKLGLLSQYAASSFATAAPTSTGASATATWDASAQTLTKPQG